MRLARCAPLVIVAGCGGNGAHAPIDAATNPPSDAATDAAEVEIDALPAITHTHYVLDHELLPVTEVAAREHAFDLDGDTIVDNHVAVVLAEYESMGYESQRTIDAWFARGTAIMLADLGADDYSDEPNARFTIYQGANPMPPACAGPGFTNCGKHLEGTGSFSLKAGAPVDPPLTGTITSGKLTAGPGRLTVQFAIGLSTPITVTLVGARVELTTTATTLTGKIGGAITQAEISTQVLPGLREGFAAAVYRDCNPFADPPACECQPGSLGASVIARLDNNPSDCGITLTEVQNDPMTAAQLTPDVTVEGQPAVSIGFGVSAVPGSFVAP